MKKSQWWYVAVFSISRFCIGMVRPFGVGFLEPSQAYLRPFTIPIQYAYPGSSLSALLKSLIPWTFVVGLFHAFYMLLTLGIAWMMNEMVDDPHDIQPWIRAVTLYGYLFWFGTIQSETAFTCHHPLAFLLMAMTYILYREKDRLYCALGTVVVYYKALYHPLAWWYIIGRLSRDKRAYWWSALAVILPSLWHLFHGAHSFAPSLNLGVNVYCMTLYIQRHTGATLGMGIDSWPFQTIHCAAVLKWAVHQIFHHPFYYLEAVANAIFIFFGFTGYQCFMGPLKDTTLCYYNWTTNYWLYPMTFVNFWRALGIKPVVMLLFYAGLRGHWRNALSRMSMFAWYTMVYTFLIAILVGFIEANYYRLMIDPLMWLGIGYYFVELEKRSW